MAGYVKKIAVIKQLKGGFSADGGVISGLIKIETYAGYLKAEVSLINFAPLSEGRYVFGLSDGEHTVVFEDVLFECESEFNCQNGFAFVVCFLKGTVSPIASAYCGQAGGFLPALTQEMQRREQVNPKKDNGAAYDDEAVSEVNYYELEADKSGEIVCESEKKEEMCNSSGEDEKDIRPVEVEKERRADGLSTDGQTAGSSGEKAQSDEPNDEEIAGGLAGGDFYSRMQGDIEKIFASYPKDGDLEEVLVGGRFVKIEYGESAYYAFGVLYVGGNPAYICYGVPSSNANEPPKSLKGFSSYIPCKSGGYWMTYQDAKTGVSVDVELI
ncbi:MAG: hypothetical protein ACI4MN_05140 [Candidatus Coproplasma sp.]